MEYVTIDGVAVPVSRVILGTDWLGARRHVHFAGRKFQLPLVDRKLESAYYELLDGVTEAGCSAFDTARFYSDSERALGAWLRARSIRERVAVISKGGHPGPGSQSRLTPREISGDLERSLKALRTDYIDVYLLHYDDPQVAVGPLLDTLNRHLISGKVRCFGVSNWATSRIADAASYAEMTNQTSFAVSSVQFSLPTWRHPPWPNARTISGDGAAGERRWYEQSQLWVLAYSSLAMGFFSSSRPYSDGRDPGNLPNRLGDEVFVSPENLDRLKRARAMAARLGISPGRLALAWVLGWSTRVLAIVGARSTAAYVDAAGACAVDLSDGQRAWLYDGTEQADG